MCPGHGVCSFDPPGPLSAGMSCEVLVTFKPMVSQRAAQGAVSTFIKKNSPTTPRGRRTSQPHGAPPPGTSLQALPWWPLLRHLWALPRGLAGWVAGRRHSVTQPVGHVTVVYVAGLVLFFR